MTTTHSPWKAALKAVGGALVGTLAVRWLSIAVLDIPPDFPPLAAPGPTIFFTTVSGLVAAGVFAVVKRTAGRPEQLFKRIAVVVLLMSFVPDFWLLSEGGAQVFPGANPTGVGVLMLMHVVAAAVIVRFLTAGSGGAEEPG